MVGIAPSWNERGADGYFLCPYFLCVWKDMLAGVGLGGDLPERRRVATLEIFLFSSQ